MYPDFLSLTGESYVANMYKKYGAIIYQWVKVLNDCVGKASLNPFEPKSLIW